MTFSFRKNLTPSGAGFYLFIALVLSGLYFTTWKSYLLFHSLSEIFSVVVAFAVFMIAWNSRKYIESTYLLFIGVSYLFVGFLDILHTLSYKGMAIFTDYDYYANQLWIAARGMESLSLLYAFRYLYRDYKPDGLKLLAAYTVITALLTASIFHWKIFPVCFVEGVGQTPFKIYSEYAICTILMVCVLLLFRNRGKFEASIWRLVLLSLIFTIISELAFTFYISNYGLSNLVGHYFKIFSFIAIYVALVQNGVQNPYNLIFRELSEANLSLLREVEARKAAEDAREVYIAELKKALEEIKTLKGIIPICMHCKKIRNDEGYWNQLESYISAHSEAYFSHGVCPECLENIYGETEEE